MKRSVLFVLSAATIVVAAIAIYFMASPHVTLRGLRSALISGDSTALEDRVDFPRVRDGLKAQLNAALLKQTQSELKDNPFGGLALVLLPKLVDSMVDAFVTPEGLAAVARGDKPKTESSSAPADPQRPRKDPFSNARVTREALDRFSIWVANDNGEEARFVFHRYGLRWRLTGIIIPIDTPVTP